MKRRLYNKLFIAITVFAIAVSVINISTGAALSENKSGGAQESSEQTVAPLLARAENSPALLTTQGDGYELPFVPIETKHEWDGGTVTTPATCTQAGVKTYTCKYNSSHTYTEVIPADGHKPAEAVFENEVAATCTDEGSYDEVIYCSVCKQEISREKKTVPVNKDAHNWGEWIRTENPTETTAGEETRVCKNNPLHTETVYVPPLEPTVTVLSFIDDEVIIIAKSTAIPGGAAFDVQKIVPPPAKTVEQIQNSLGSDTSVLSHYEVRLKDAAGALVTHLSEEITIKTKMPEQYVGNDCVKIVQQNEDGASVFMNSRWEGEYICYNTDWLEAYD